MLQIWAYQLQQQSYSSLFDKHIYFFFIMYSIIFFINFIFLTQALKEYIPHMGLLQSQPKYEQNSMEQQQHHFSQLFTDMCYQHKKQYITIKGYFQRISDNTKPDMCDVFQVDDSTTINDIKTDWLLKYQDNQLVKDSNQEYAVTLQLRRSLDDNVTVADIKYMLKIRLCNVKVEVFIFPQQIHNGCTESAIQYGIYEEVNFFDVETTFKIVHSSLSQPLYFAITTPREITIQTLKRKLETPQSPSQQPSQIRLKHAIERGYRLRIKHDAWTKQQMDAIKRELRYSKMQQKMQIKNGFIDFTQLPNFYLRQICPPGEVIYLQPLDEEFQIVKQNQLSKSKQQQHMEIRIACTQRRQNKYVNITVTENYHTIRNVQVSTLLTEHRVYDAMFTSLKFNDLLIRPYEKFSVLDSIVQSATLNTLELTAIPQNLLFYSQLMMFSDLNHANLIENLKSRYLGCSQQDNNEFRERFIERRNSLMMDFGDQQRMNVVESILLYTGPFLYSELNKFIRSNSLAFLNSGVSKQQGWQYPFCENILKSLDKFPNYQGLVYRGSSGYKYKMQPGEVIEWNGFTSTTNNISIAQKFISISFVYPHIFEIETFSGKYVADFSFYRNESEVLILPYTKFKVMSITLKDGIKYIKLKELPLPKKIPGRLIVWVDTNYKQNARDFNEIVTANKLTNTEIVQLQSNEHLQIWLQQYSSFVTPPLINIAFISNMNRPPHYQNEGVRTFDIIRAFSPHAQVVYYIQQPQQKVKILQQAQIHIDNKRVFVASRKSELQSVVLNHLWRADV